MTLKYWVKGHSRSLKMIPFDNPKLKIAGSSYKIRLIYFRSISRSSIHIYTRNSAIANKRDAFVQYALAWLTPLADPRMLPCKFGHSMSYRVCISRQNPQIWVHWSLGMQCVTDLKTIPSHYMCLHAKFGHSTLKVVNIEGNT